MSEGWANNQEQFSGRSYNNSNFRGPRREGGGAGGRPSYNAGGGGGGGGGGYGGGQRQSGGYGQNGGGGGYGGGQSYDSSRPSYGQNRPPRNNFGGQPRNGGGGGGGGGYQVVGGQSSVIEIDSNKVGMVIGRGGGKIREIQENFQVHVKIDRDPGENGLTGVTIRGEEVAIEQAKCFIQDLVAVK